MKRRKQKVRPLLEELEPRILHSADASALVPAPPLVQLVEMRVVETAPSAGDAAAAEQTVRPAREVVVVDSAVDGYQAIVDDLIASRDANLAVYVLDSARDGVEQIGAILAGRSDVQAVHLISHGAQGRLELGSGVLDRSALEKNPDAIAGWARALTADADILIYGCDVAAGVEGRAFVDALAGLTGADVAASTDTTGTAAKGGDWTLEYNVGPIEAAAPLSASFEQAWQGTLGRIDAGNVSTTYWAPTVAGAWETKSLTTLGIPANAVVEIALYNTSGSQAHTIGVRAVGSSLDRTFTLPKDSTGAESVEMLVQADASGRIQTFGDSTGQIAFSVLGYWTGGTYVETAGSFTVGADATWETHSLSAYGVAAGSVAEVVISNTSANSPQVGVRSEGSTLMRATDIRNRSATSGAETLTMLVNVGSTPAANIEAYAQSDRTGLTYRVVGYWSAAPGAYVETFTTLGKPTLNSTWQSTDLATAGLPSGAVADVLIVNSDATAQVYGGVRTVGSTDPNRWVSLDSAVGGATGAPSNSRMFVTPGGAGSTSIEWYDTSAALSNFYMTGYFVSNSAPALTGANNLTSIAEDAVSNTGTAVSALIAGMTSDADGNTPGIAVTAVDNTNGAWQYSLDAGGTWSAFGAPNGSSARLLAPAALVRFVPNADWNGTVGSGLTFRAWDRTAGTAGGTANVTVNGGVTPYSSATASAAITVTAVNDAPVLSGTNDLGGINRNPVANPGTLVSDLLAGHVNDADSGALRGIAVSAVDDTNGAWEYSTDGGGSWSALGAAAPASARLLAADALTFVRFVPTLNWSGAVTGGLTFRAWDRTSGSAGATADTTSNGAATAFSSATASASITVTDTNNAPTLTGHNDLDPIVEDAVANGGTLVSALIAGYAADVDPAALAGIAVTAVDDSNGTWQYSLNGGTAWTSFGTPTAAVARLLAADTVTYVRFVPNANWNGTVAPGLTFRAWDRTSGTAGSTADTTTNGGTSAFSAAVESAGATVAPLNDRPVRLAGSVADLTVNEDAPSASLGLGALAYGTGGGTDESAQTLAYTVTAVPGASLGRVTLADGTTVSAGTVYTLAQIQGMRFVASGNASGGPATFGWSVVDNGGVAGGGADTLLESLSITVNSVNDAPSGADKTVTIGENASYTFTLADFGFSDAGDSPANALLNVRIDSVAGGGTLSLSGLAVSAGQTITQAAIAAGNLAFAPALNANGAGYASFTFRVQDDGGVANGGADTDTVARAITMNVTAVNNAPVRTAGSVVNLTVLEDAPATSLGLGALAYGAGGGADEAVQTLTYTVTAVPAAALGTVVLADGTTAVTASTTYSLAQLQGMQFKAAPNASGGPATFSWNVADSGGTANGGVDTLAQSLTISVIPVNDAPAGTSHTVTTLEDTAYTFTIADFGFSDPNDTAPNALLNVKIAGVPSVGTLTLSGIAVTSGQSVSAASIGAGNLRFTPAPNANGASYASFTFQMQDDGGVANGGADLEPIPHTMRIDVTPVSDAPSGASKTVTVLEDTSYAFVSADFGFTDSADGNTLLGVRIAALPAAGSLTLAGTAVTANQVVASAAIAAGDLKFTPAANANGAAYASFTFQVQDNGGVANGGADLDPIARTITMNVTPVNDAPAGTNRTVTTLEDTPYAFVIADFGFTDAVESDGLLAVRIASLPVNGSLTLNGVAVGTNQVVLAVNIAAGDLRFVPAADANGAGYASFTFRVEDDGGTANGGVDLDPMSRTMMIDVVAVSDAPAGTSRTVTTREDTPYTFGVADFGFTDPRDSNAFANVKIAALPGAGALTLGGVAVTANQFVSIASIAAGDLRFTPATDAHGAAYASFTFRVQDDGGTANGGVDLDPVARTMAIAVTPVNDAPAGTDRIVTTLEDTPYTFVAADFGFTDTADGPNALLAVRIGAVPATGTLAFDFVPVAAGQVVTATDIAAGKLMFIPALDGNASPYASFTFQVQDDGGTANGGADTDPVARTMTIAVAPVNDAPSGTSNTVTALEDTPYVFTAADFGFSDVRDANALMDVKIASLPAAGTLTLSGVLVTANQSVSAARIAAGDLQFTPAPDAQGAAYASFTFQVRDNGGTADGGIDLDPVARTMTIAVAAVNDAPAGSDHTVTTLEDTAYRFAPADFGFTDTHEGNAFAAVKIVSVPGSGSLTLAGVAVVAGQRISAASIAAGDLAYTPGANDNGTAYAAFTFQVQDDGGTANGGADTDVLARTMTIDVAPVNDAPSGADTTVTTNERTEYTFRVADFGFSDSADRPANALLNVKIAALSGSGTLTLGGTAVVAGQIVPAGRIAAGDLKFAPAAGGVGAGYATIVFQVQDDGGTAAGGVDTEAITHKVTVNVQSAPAPAAPVIADVPPPPPTQVAPAEEAAAETTQADSRSKATLARIAAELSVAVSRAFTAPAAEASAEVLALTPTAEAPADIAASSAPASSSAGRRDSGAAAAPVVPVLFEGRSEAAAATPVAMALSSGDRVAAAATPDSAESSAEKDAAKQQAYALLTLENGVRASAIIVSAGMVTWTLHGAGLIASLLTSAPAWRHLDPLPVLAPESEKPDWGDSDGDSQREEDAADRLWLGSSQRAAETL